jgi:nicotinate-nucleotide adenylyltransferase
MRVGLLGGTFDPIHVGHLLVAESVQKHLELGSVVFIPAGRPWLKADKQVSESEHRFAMAQLAVQASPRFSVSRIEIDRPGPTYTVDTLEQMRREMAPEVELYLILGMDSLRELARWHRPERLFALCTLVGVSRPGYDDIVPAWLDEIVDGASEAVTLVRGPLAGISGTEIRRRVSEGEPLESWVPKPVEDYIMEHGLYRP